MKDLLWFYNAYREPTNAEFVDHMKLTLLSNQYLWIWRALPGKTEYAMRHERVTVLTGRIKSKQAAS